MSYRTSELQSIGVVFLLVLIIMHIRYRDAHLTSPASSKGKGLSSRSLPEQCFKLLSVSYSHLNPDAEMRRFFGAKVIATSRDEAGPSSRARRQPITQRSNLTHPRPNWWPAKLREGLTLRPLTDDEAASKASPASWGNSDEKFWTAEYSKKYKGATFAFLRTVLSGGALFSLLTRTVPSSRMSFLLDPEGFYAILQKVPWHADTILQLAELYSHREGGAFPSSLNLISIFLRAQPGGRLYRARSLYIRTRFRRSIHVHKRAEPSRFRSSGEQAILSCTAQTGHVRRSAEIDRRVFSSPCSSDLQRRGLHRTAFEFAKLLLSLDPWSDPHGAYLHLDFLAIKCSMHSWLLSFSEIFAPVISQTPSRSSEPEEPPLGYPSVSALPGWAYARALAFRAEGDSHASQVRPKCIRGQAFFSEAD